MIDAVLVVVGLIGEWLVVEGAMVDHVPDGFIVAEDTIWLVWDNSLDGAMVEVAVNE